MGLEAEAVAVLTKAASGRGRGGGEVGVAVDLLGRKLSSGLGGGFLSGLFSRARQEKASGHNHKESDNVILMGSLPSTSL